MHNGICGLSMYSTGKDSVANAVYFSMVPEQKLEPYTLKHAKFTDDFYLFIKNKDARLYCFLDMQQRQYVVVNTKEKVSVEIPAVFIESDKEIASVITQLHDDLFAYYADVFKDIGAQVLKDNVVVKL
jgi:hypothetical protein